MRPVGRTRDAALALLGLVVIAGSAVYAFVLPQTPGRLTRASAALNDDLGVWSWSSWLPVPTGGLAVALLLSLVASIWLISYAAALYLTWNRAPTRRRLALLVLPGVLACAVSAFALPTANTDVFDYIAFGRVAAVHEANPYEVPPSAFPDDPVYPYASPAHRDEPDNKLPAWTLLNRALAEVGGDDVPTNLLVYRLALLLLNLGSLALVLAVTHRVFPAALLSSAVSYAWNPVVVVYGASKTDTAMVFLFLLGLLALVRGRPSIAGIPFALSILIKLITLPLTAVVWIRELAMRRWRIVAAQAIAVAAVSVLVYSAFGGFDLFAEHVRLFGMGSGSDAPTAATPAAPRIFLALLPIVLAGVAVTFVRDGSDARLLRGLAVVALAFALLSVNPNSSWYLMTLVAVTAVAADRRLAAPTIAVTGAAFLLNSWQNASSMDFPLPELPPVPRAAVYLVPLALLALVAFAITVWRRRALTGLDPRPRRGASPGRGPGRGHAKPLQPPTM